MIKKLFLLLLSLMPFAVFGILYFAMKYFPSYEFHTVDIRGLYEAELSLFGIIPSEYFATHNCIFADLIAGISYLCWVPLPIAFAITLFLKRKTEWCIHFTLCFLLCNIIGFCIYYIHPAAPPWYVMYYGFDFQINTPGSCAELIRFDDLIGIPIFQSIYSGNSNVFAAIPSLHAAYMLITTIYAILSKQSKILISTFTCITIGIWFAAVYSAHHYIIDVALGIATSVITIILLEKYLLRITCIHRFVDKYIILVKE